MPRIPYECSVCLEATREANPRTIDGDIVCIGCVTESILPMFEEALEHEHSYPPKFGSTELKINDYSDLLGTSFTQRYQRVEVEYKVPFADRLCCPHVMRASTAPKKGDLSGPHKHALKPDAVKRLRDNNVRFVTCEAMVAIRVDWEGLRPVCYRCKGRVCGACGDPIYSSSATHWCKPTPKEPPNKAEVAGLVRGKDYQLCPRCGTGRGLLDGCNHLICPATNCVTHYCFICGAEADARGGHWSGNSQCPRYGQPGDPRAIFDRDMLRAGEQPNRLEEALAREARILPIVQRDLDDQESGINLSMRYEQELLNIRVAVHENEGVNAAVHARFMRLLDTMETNWNTMAPFVRTHPSANVDRRTAIPGTLGGMSARQQFRVMDIQMITNGIGRQAIALFPALEALLWHEDNMVFHLNQRVLLGT